jgi:hypothetical protein
MAICNLSGDPGRLPMLASTSETGQSATRIRRKDADLRLLGFVLQGP